MNLKRRNLYQNIPLLIRYVKGELSERRARKVHARIQNDEILKEIVEGIRIDLANEGQVVPLEVFLEEAKNNYKSSKLGYSKRKSSLFSICILLFSWLLVFQYSVKVERSQEAFIAFLEIESNQNDQLPTSNPTVRKIEQAIPKANTITQSLIDSTATDRISNLPKSEASLKRRFAKIYIGVTKTKEEVEQVDGVEVYHNGDFKGLANQWYNIPFGKKNIIVLRKEGKELIELIEIKSEEASRHNYSFEEFNFDSLKENNSSQIQPTASNYISEEMLNPLKPLPLKNPELYNLKTYTEKIPLWKDTLKSKNNPQNKNHNYSLKPNAIVSEKTHSEEGLSFDTSKIEKIGNSIIAGVDSITVSRIDTCTFFAPNAMAPGFANENMRFFRPVGNGLKNYQIQIYSPWGNLVWTSDELENGRPIEQWDGSYKGYPLPSGAYTWVAQITFVSGDNQTRRGIVYLLH